MLAMTAVPLPIELLPLVLMRGEFVFGVYGGRVCFHRVLIMVGC